MDHNRYIDPNRSTDIIETDYYKDLQKKLKQKVANHMTQAQSEKIQTSQNSAEIEGQLTSPDNKKIKDLFDIKDEVKLFSMSWEDEFTELNDRDKPNDDKKQIENQKSDIKNDAKKIWRHLSHKIDFQKKVPELKELFTHSLAQSRSHNAFTAKFAQFKVGIVGQILAWIGVPIEELKKLRRDALDSAISDNIEMMSENVYNLELSEIVFGITKSSRQTRRMYAEIENQLVLNMNNLGRPGYWSKSQLIESKIKQCERICEEFTIEKEKLEHQYAFYYGKEELEISK